MLVKAKGWQCTCEEAKWKHQELDRDRQSGWPFQLYVATCELASLFDVFVVFIFSLDFSFSVWNLIVISGGALKTKGTSRVCQWICGVSMWVWCVTVCVVCYFILFIL